MSWSMEICASPVEVVCRWFGRVLKKCLGPWIISGTMMAGAILPGTILAWSLQAHSQTGDPAPAPPEMASVAEAKPWWRGITTDGFLSFSYTYNSNTPVPRINQFRVFDFNDNAPQLDVAQLVIQRAIGESKQFGFRLDLIAGSGVPEVTAAYGLFRDTHTLLAHHVDVSQVFLSYILPVGKGLRFDVGKYATHMGYEVIGGYDGYNDNFSRGFIFGYGIPFSHTGVKATYAFTGKVTAMVSLCNGWDDVQRLNHAYTAAAQIAFTPTNHSSLTFNFIHGPERRQNTHDQRSVYELVGTWKPVAKFSLSGDGLYGHEQNGVAISHDAIWRGLAGYAKYSPTSRFSLTFRGEVFNDGGGTRTGSDQILHGFTLTPEYVMDARPSRITSHFGKADGKVVLRGEVRLDRSNKSVFLAADSHIRNRQFTTAVNLIYLF